MELFGIALSIPVAFVASMIYCLFLSRVAFRFTRVCRWLRLTSLLIVILFAIELVLLMSLGAVRSRGVLGPSFYIVHIVLFFVGPPALANLLVLPRRTGVSAEWYVAGVLCTVFAFCLVLLQYSVSESLYGIDGDNGPYSKIIAHSASRKI
jgi:hypothetical protein